MFKKVSQLAIQWEKHFQIKMKCLRYCFYLFIAKNKQEGVSTKKIRDKQREKGREKGKKEGREEKEKKKKQEFKTLNSEVLKQNKTKNQSK